MTAGLGGDLNRRYRAGEFHRVVVNAAAAASDCRAGFTEVMGWFESAAPARVWADPVPSAVFPPGGIYRDVMFRRIEREGRRWHVGFSGSSLHSVLLGAERGLGIAPPPLAATRGAGLRPCAAPGAEPAMVVALHVWATGGPAGDLVGRMTDLLDRRHQRGRPML